MKIDYSPCHNYNYPVKKTAFQGSLNNFEKQIGDIFSKSEISLAEKQTFLEKLKNIWGEITAPDKILGKGFQGTVYKIDKDYAIKVRNTEIKHFRDTEIVEKGKNKFKILETYYGDPVATIGKFAAIKILRNLGEHIPAGIPESLIKNAKNENEIDKYYEKVYLPMFAKVPQESYDAIARDFSRLNKMISENGEYYSFDSVNPNNIVLAGNKLRLTDEIDTIITPDANSSGKLIDILLYRMTRLKRACGYGQHNDDAKSILKKIIIASEKANLPYETLPKDITAWEAVSGNLNIKDDIVKNLEIIRYKYPDLTKRISEIEKYTDILFKS